MRCYWRDLNTTSCATTDKSTPGRRRLPQFAAILLVTLLAQLGFTFTVSAQQSGQQPGQQYDSTVYSGMRWRLIGPHRAGRVTTVAGDRKSTRLNSSHGYISYAVFCLKKKKKRRDKDTSSIG